MHATRMQKRCYAAAAALAAAFAVAVAAFGIDYNYDDGHAAAANVLPPPRTMLHKLSALHVRQARLYSRWENVMLRMYPFLMQ